MRHKLVSAANIDLPGDKGGHFYALKIVDRGVFRVLVDNAIGNRVEMSVGRQRKEVAGVDVDLVGA